jgi:type II secretory ATPase GspE/PulE/Tfp pilus assembly ATPase PilB-like protein
MDDITKQLNLNELNLPESKQEKKVSAWTFYKGKGCKQCDGLGYKGRVGLYEILEVSPTISELIIKNADTAEIGQQARKEGMKSMFYDGLLKAQQGMTTIEELLRVIRE